MFSHKHPHPAHWIVHGLMLLVIIGLVIWKPQPPEVLPSEEPVIDLVDEEVTETRSYDEIIASIPTCGTPAGFAGGATDELKDYVPDIQNIVTHGYQEQYACKLPEEGLVGFLFARAGLEQFGEGYLNCDIVCDEDIFAVLDTRTRDLYAVASERQLGFHAEAYSSYCAIDTILPGEELSETDFLLYCGTGESGGLTSWYEYSFNDDALVTVQQLISYDEGFDVLEPELLELFRHKTNDEFQNPPR